MTTATVVETDGSLGESTTDGARAAARAARLSTALAELRAADEQARVTTGRAFEAAVEDEQAHARAAVAWRAARAAGWTDAELGEQGFVPIAAVSWERHLTPRRGPRPGAG